MNEIRYRYLPVKFIQIINKFHPRLNRLCKPKETLKLPQTCILASIDVSSQIHQYPQQNGQAPVIKNHTRTATPTNQQPAVYTPPSQQLAMPPFP